MFGGTNLKPEALQALQIGADRVDLPPDWLVDYAPTLAEGVDRLANVGYDVAIVVPPVSDFTPIDETFSTGSSPCAVPCPS